MTTTDDDVWLAEQMGVSVATVKAWGWADRARQGKAIRKAAGEAWAHGAHLVLPTGETITPDEAIAAAEAIERGDA
jgi:hypothetical protein